MSEHIEGFVENILFRNEENGYTVFDINLEKNTLTCVGTVQSVHEGEYVKMDGDYTVHAVYGKQFKITTCTTSIPGDAKALERYLGGGAIRGVGPKLAQRIIKYFKEDTLRILEEEPERLAEVKGISENKAREIAVALNEQSQMQSALVFMAGYGISTKLGIRIYEKYQDTVFNILRENPYKLADDIAGVGFKTADVIASRVGIEKDSPHRIRSGILYILKQALAQGEIYLPLEVLKNNAAAILGADGEIFDECMENLVFERLVISRKEEDPDKLDIYLADTYYAELSTARMLADLNVRCPLEPEKLDKDLARITKSSGIELDELQHRAIREAAENGVFILTGGPGTGKTTTINAMIQYFLGHGMSIKLAAPTGRAAKRMQEATGYEASTIHKFLELQGNPEDDERRVYFQRNKDHPLEADVIIVDEMSMVDIFLMNALLGAVVPGTRLIFVGDMNQLPSIGAGRVLHDMIASECFSVVKLEKIFRQAAQSDIIMNAHRINAGEEIVIDNKSKDFFFMERSDIGAIQKIIVQLVSEKLPAYTSSTPSDVQVLSPMRKGQLGVENLNRILQKYINPAMDGKNEIEFGNYIFREGDKVMQIKNDYQLEWETRGKYDIVINRGTGVFNGDVGIIQSIRRFDHIVTVLFDDERYVEYDFSLLDELEPAYAATVHKSQGSEYKAVVIPLLGGPQILLTRNLLYTAVTRAKNCVVILGSRRTLRDMIANTREDARYSSLAKRLKEVYGR